MTYDELVSGGEKALRSLLGKQETLELEFKANEPRDPIFESGALTKPGKKILAKEISAFANSAGGLLVFGVDCRVIDKVDQAERLTPIPSLARAETSVRDAASELLQPRHDGIRVASIPSDEAHDSGYIVVDVPRSERRPHRSEATDQKQYFKRSGASAFAMEHYDIEDAFRRLSSPSIKLEVSYSSGLRVGIDEQHYKLELALENTSDVTAKMISMQIWDRSGAVFGEDRHTPVLIKQSFYKGKIHLAGPVDFALHPGEKRLFHQMLFVARTTTDGLVVCGTYNLEPGSIRFDYSISAENMRMESGRYELGKQEMHNFKQVFDAAAFKKKRSGF
ncbi:ATP-binding protein [Agrobacterium tumefaciens]|nr:ATP-binding protein [Agrobacterium tumefaciens]